MLGFERGEPPARPFSVDTLRAFIVFLTTDQELPTQGRWQTVSGETKLRGRGAGAPFVDLHFWAIKATENAFSLTSNVDSPPIKSRLTQLRNAHISHSAPSYDVVEVRGFSSAAFTFPRLRCLVNARCECVAALQRAPIQTTLTFWRVRDAVARKPQELPRLRTAIFAAEYDGKPNPMRHGLMRVMLFTMVILQHALIARASLLTDFCPTMDAIRLPDEKEQWDADGFPQFVTLELTNWKGNTRRRRQVRVVLPRSAARGARLQSYLLAGVARAVLRRASPCSLGAARSVNGRGFQRALFVSYSWHRSHRPFTSSATPSTRSFAPWLRSCSGCVSCMIGASNTAPFFPHFQRATACCALVCACSQPTMSAGSPQSFGTWVGRRRCAAAIPSAVLLRCGRHAAALPRPRCSAPGAGSWAALRSAATWRTAWPFRDDS